MAALLTGSCDSFSDLSDTPPIAPLSVGVTLSFNVADVTEYRDLRLTLDNFEEDLHYEHQVTGTHVQVDDILPGIYTVNLIGTALDASGNEYYVNGNLQNKALFEAGTTLQLEVKGLKVSPLVFKEIYYACSKTPLNKSYIKEQYYELYNNSSSVLYLDGIHFADVEPQIAKSSSVAAWPEEDGDDYVYGVRVWKIPGNGTDYPLQPGESCIIAQYAANHQLEIYNPNSPVDATTAEFEFYMGDTAYPNSAAPDMDHVFYQGSADIGRVKQYLTTVFGPALVVFRVPEGESWDPVGDPNMSTRNLATTKATRFAKIPVRYVLDAVESAENEANGVYKRLPGVLDAGFTYVGGTYNGKGIYRKISLDENGQPIRRENGAYIYQDTNNSTDDFVSGITPEFRRNEAQMPSWNHTLNP